MHEECVLEDVLRKTYAKMIPEDAAAIAQDAKQATNGSTPGKAGKGSKAHRRSSTKAAAGGKQPWEGKFTASINTSQPGVAEKVTITDERGQDPETWTEDVKCLKCGKVVD